MNQVLITELEKLLEILKKTSEKSEKEILIKKIINKIKDLKIKKE